MSDLEFTGGLDFSEALSAVDDLSANIESRLGDALAASAASLSEILTAAAQDAVAQPLVIEADANAITPEIDAAISASQLELPLTADVSAATADVASFVSEVDATPATIDVTVDTADADAAIGDLGDSIQTAGGKAGAATSEVAGFGEGAGIVGGAAALARGEVGGLGEVALGTGLATAGAVAGVAALGGGIFELAQKGLEATSATERFEQVIGSAGDAVRNVHVGDLSIQLLDLTAKMGSTRTATEEAAATIFAFAQNAGASQAGAATFSGELFSLASRAVALKPSLGDVSDVAAAMTVGLGRARSAAQQFGISISQDEINTRALSDTGKASAATLTAYEKSVAGAEIAVSKYGGTLKSTIEEGSKNAAIEQKRLNAEIADAIEEIGKPLAAPLLDAIHASLPDVVAVAGSLGQLAGAALPAVASAASLAAVPLEITAAAIKDIPQPALAAGIGAVALNSGLHALAGILPTVAVEEAGVSAATVEMAGAQTAAASAATGLAADVSLTALSLGQASVVAAAGVGAFALTTAALHSIFDDNFGKTIEDVFDKIDDATKKVAETTDSSLLPKFKELVRDSTDAKVALNAMSSAIGDGRQFAIGNAAVESLTKFRDLAKDNYTTAELLVAQMHAAGESTTGYDRVLQQLAPDQRANAAATQSANDAVTLLTGSYTDQISVLDRVEDALLGQYDKTFASLRANEALTDATNAYTVAAQAATAAGGADAAANEAQKRALEGAEEAALKAAAAARDKAESDHEAQGAAAAHTAGVDAQVQSLQFFASTLAPDSPLRQFVEQYIAQLRSIPPTASTTVTANVDQALANVHALLDEIARIPQTPVGVPGLGGNPQPAGTFGPSASDQFLAAIAYGQAPHGAAGLYVHSQAGGVPIIAGEAGVDEVLVSPANINGAIANLDRAGILDDLFAAAPRELVHATPEEGHDERVIRVPHGIRP